LQEKTNNEVLKPKVFDHFLDQEVKRAQRYRLFFSLILAQPNVRLSTRGIKAEVKKKEIIKTITHLLRSEIRGSDIIGWVDKGKLFILLLETGNHTALLVGNRLIELIQTYSFDGERVSLSMGAVRFPTDGVNKKDLIDKANLLLRQAKAQGESLILLPEE
jgi:diguanylate cyclase (GGDEF)-like protein